MVYGWFRDGFWIICGWFLDDFRWFVELMSPASWPCLGMCHNTLMGQRSGEIHSNVSQQKSRDLNKSPVDYGCTLPVQGSKVQNPARIGQFHINHVKSAPAPKKIRSRGDQWSPIPSLSFPAGSRIGRNAAALGEGLKGIHISEFTRCSHTHTQFPQRIWHDMAILNDTHTHMYISKNVWLWFEYAYTLTRNMEVSWDPQVSFIGIFHLQLYPDSVQSPLMETRLGISASISSSQRSSGGFHKWRISKMVNLYGKIQLKWINMDDLGGTPIYGNPDTRGLLHIRRRFFSPRPFAASAWREATWTSGLEVVPLLLVGDFPWTFARLGKITELANLTG